MGSTSTTWQSGRTGNPAGRPKGAHDRRSTLPYEVPSILKALAKAAKLGDIQSARLILERTLQPLKSAAEGLTLPGRRHPGEPGAYGARGLRPGPHLA
ncbi:MAG: hypothetical protein ACREXU_22025 [Gammaproteobacteria bacterium]